MAVCLKQLSVQGSEIHHMPPFPDLQDIKIWPDFYLYSGGRNKKQVKWSSRNVVPKILCNYCASSRWFPGLYEQNMPIRMRLAATALQGSLGIPLSTRGEPGPWKLSVQRGNPFFLANYSSALGIFLSGKWNGTGLAWMAGLCDVQTPFFSGAHCWVTWADD